MTALPPRLGRWTAPALGVLLAACQPLPHPFADDRPPASLLRIRDSASVSIAPVEGAPAGVAAKLGAATAAALLRRDIPASDKTTSLGSYLLYGRIVEGKPADGKAPVAVLWRLYDSRGGTVGERSAKVDGENSEWTGASDAAVARLAAASAAALAPLLIDEGPAGTAPAADATATAPGGAPAAGTAAAGGAAGGAVPPTAAASSPADKRVRVAVGKVVGAPGDGAKSLPAAIAALLKRQDLTLVEAGGKADLTVEGEVAVGPAKADKQHVKIVWRVRRADGAEIGTVGQENDVPRGMLDGAWGEVAHLVAMSAGDGLLQLLERGAPAAGSPPPKS